MTFLPQNLTSLARVAGFGAGAAADGATFVMSIAERVFSSSVSGQTTGEWLLFKSQ